ncbi:MAG: hypothetical protein GY865_02395 [candidate division Zixibacteria bacterium]|nr:hypothetical protein [candidate division Zixibacteria bacterium]
MGELYSFENDMHGTNEHRGIFSKCEAMRLNDEFRPILYHSSDKLKNDNIDEWGVNRAAADSIEIWDKYPLSE